MSSNDPRREARRGYVRGPHLKLRNGVYYVAGLKEFPKGLSLKTRDPVAAERAFRAVVANPTAAAPDVRRAAPPESTLALIFDGYENAAHSWTTRTRGSAVNRLKAFDAWMRAHGVTYPHELTREKLDAWVKERKGKVSRRTINRDFRPVRRALAWGMKRGLCGPVPAAVEWEKVREPARTKVRFVPDAAERAKVFAKLDEINAGAGIAARCLAVSGLRIEELRRLTLVDVRNGAVHVRPEEGAADVAEPTKGYAERAIPLHPTALAFFDAFFVWRAGKGGKGKPAGCSESWLLRKLAEACRRASVPVFTLHDLRAAFATELFDRGVGLVTIQAWMGHARPETTEGYIRRRRSDAAQVVPLLVESTVQIVGV